MKKISTQGPQKWRLPTRRADAIDIVKLFARWKSGGDEQWAIFINNAFNNRDMKAIGDMIVRLNDGMTNAADQKMNTEEICAFFTKLKRGLEKTANYIMRARYPHDPSNAASIALKKRRDKELEQWFRDISRG